MSPGFRHADRVWQEFPALVPGVLHVRGISADVEVEKRIERYAAIARQRLAGSTESELPEIRAWRRAFAAMGLKPTQYRCASEALLRRFRKEGALPRIHPVIDLCNAASLAFAIPIAVLDLAGISGALEVRHAVGDESYLTFGGEIEHPAAGEVVYVDAANQAHARRWTNRQSGSSAVRERTEDVLIVAEALHETAPADIARLVSALGEDLAACWPVRPVTAVLSRANPELRAGA